MHMCYCDVTGSGCLSSNFNLGAPVQNILGAPCVRTIAFLCCYHVHSTVEQRLWQILKMLFFVVEVKMV